MDYGDRGQHRDNPQDGGHAVEQGSDDDQHQALRAFHETNTAGTNQRFGTSASVADHDRADHYDRGKHYIEEPIAAGVKDQQAEELGSVAVAVNHRIEETAEAGHAIAGSSHGAIHQVKKTGPDDH